MVAVRHTTTATGDAAGDQPKNWQATTQEPIRYHDSVHTFRTGTAEDDAEGIDEDIAGDVHVGKDDLDVGTEEQGMMTEFGSDETRPRWQPITSGG